MRDKLFANLIVTYLRELHQRTPYNLTVFVGLLSLLIEAIFVWNVFLGKLPKTLRNKKRQRVLTFVGDKGLEPLTP